MSESLAKWGSYDEDAAAEEQEVLDAEGGGADFMKLKVGRNVVRILPPKLGIKSPFRVTYQHYIELPGQEHPVVFVCPRVAAKEFCPACDIAKKLRNSGNKADEKRGKGMLPKRRVFCNAIKREEAEKGVQVLAFGKLIHEELVGIRRDPAAGGDFTHPTQGFDIVIKREGTGKFDTEYTVSAAREDTPILDGDEADIVGILESMYDLEDFAKVLEAEEIEAKLRGEEYKPDKGGGGRGGRGGGGGDDSGESQSRGGRGGRGGRGRGEGAPAIDTTGEPVDGEAEPGY